MSVELSQFHNVFFAESREHIQEMEALFVSYLPEYKDLESINRIFRAAHSIKGGSGMFGFSALTDLTHLMESFLDLVRKERVELTTANIDTLLSALDVLSVTVDAYENDKPLDTQLLSDCKKQLSTLLDNTSHFEDTNTDFGFFNVNEADDFGFFDVDEEGDEEDDFGFFATTNISETENTTFATETSTAKTSEHPLDIRATSDTHDHSTISKIPSVKPKELSAKSPLTITHSVSANKQTTQQSIRVDTNKIDTLINIMGELVIADVMLQQVHSDTGKQHTQIHRALELVNANIRDMQEAVMSMRMMPLSFIFNRFPRLVRELAKELGKEVNLDIKGSETEIDKGMIEQLVDPITHLIRNSIDHGIETPTARKEKGKPQAATVTLAAKQKGSYIYITVKDNGAGLDKQKILETAYGNNLIKSMDLSDEDTWPLILQPGFSTATAVTNISGRGVGMDVVVKNIEALGGKLDIFSESGKGSTFTIRLPLTMAIIEGMKVSCAGQTYIIPMHNIIESFRPTKEQVKTITDDYLINIREHYLPIVSLHDLLHAEAYKPHPEESIMMIIEVGHKRYCLHVDSLLGQQQVVIKSLEKNYKAVPCMSGATIMADGSVAFILDLEQLALRTLQRTKKQLQHEAVDE